MQHPETDPMFIVKYMSSFSVGIRMQMAHFCLIPNMEEVRMGRWEVSLGVRLFPKSKKTLWDWINPDNIFFIRIQNSWKCTIYNSYLELCFFFFYQGTNILVCIDHKHNSNVSSTERSMEASKPWTKILLTVKIRKKNTRQIKLNTSVRPRNTSFRTHP